MRDYAKIIDRMLERFQLKEIRMEDYAVCYLFVNMRHLIELHNLGTTYPTINFYANWCLHDKLDRNIFARDILLSIEKELPEDGKVTQDFIDVVCENMKLDKLQEEIVDLSKTYGFRDVWSSDVFWNQLYSVLMNLVVFKSLVFTSKDNNETATNNKQNFKKENAMTITLILEGCRGQQAEWSVEYNTTDEYGRPNKTKGPVKLRGGLFTKSRNK